MVENGGQANNNTENLRMLCLLFPIFTEGFQEPYRYQHYKLS